METQLADARRFAADAYLKALYAGTNLAPAERDAVVARLAALDPDAMTPRDALAALYELRNLLAG